MSRFMLCVGGPMDGTVVSLMSHVVANDPADDQNTATTPERVTYELRHVAMFGRTVFVAVPTGTTDDDANDLLWRHLASTVAPTVTV